ncbi:hypothetical protein Rhe02_45750 [Rhizocola hellebori]|uniref:Uncharacterized protein n=1 Tax=Rhizocola hellebori TaxID=1392758 RepID=A0A8J3VI22_9ACTN|nr:hypothetical protein [Rhizocola hellebori]GIH06508.1 hypothetical protein Rhe02_45750 [Rhizocola hellebori]
MAHTFGQSDADDAVVGKSGSGRGIVGESKDQAGVAGISKNFVGVWGESASDGHPGVFGRSQKWQGVHGESDNQAGVVGISKNFVGVWGESSNDKHPGVFGRSQKWQGVHGESDDQAGVVGVSKHFVGVWGEGSPAGFFKGDVHVTGDLILEGADLAEQFEVADTLGCGEEVGPGMVVVLNDDGALAPSTREYDTRVAGVVSGAGDRVPAIVLDRQETGGSSWRRAVALVGKAWCQADATTRPIQVGDLLTTSSSRGHAMAASDRHAAFGAIIGKALTPLTSGTGLVLVLVGLG